MDSNDGKKHFRKGISLRCHPNANLKFPFHSFRPKRHSEDGFSDGEEEFYFTEKDDDQDDFGDFFPHPLALSPTPTQSHFDMVKSPWAEPCSSPDIVESTENSPQNLRFNWDFHISDQTSAAKTAALQQPAHPNLHITENWEAKARNVAKSMEWTTGIFGARSVVGKRHVYDLLIARWGFQPQVL